MINETIGYTPETIAKSVILAEMPNVRKPEDNDIIKDGIFFLNQSDQILADANDEAFEKYVEKMAARGISAMKVTTAL